MNETQSFNLIKLNSKNCLYTEVLICNSLRWNYESWRHHSDESSSVTSQRKQRPILWGVTGCCHGGPARRVARQQQHLGCRAAAGARYDVTNGTLEWSRQTRALLPGRRHLRSNRNEQQTKYGAKFLRAFGIIYLTSETGAIRKRAEWNYLYFSA